MINDLVGSAGIPVVVLILIVGFLMLIKGADFFVDGASSIAKQLHVPGIIVGLTVVAMGTSLPETAVSVTASVTGNNELAVSNAVGSNIFNMMMVIGVCAILTPVYVEVQSVKRDIPFSAIVAVLLLGLGVIGIGDADRMMLGHIDGVILLICFAMYLFVLIRQAMRSLKEGRSSDSDEDEAKVADILPIWKSVVFIVLGGAAIALGGDLTVDAASRIAIDLGMSQTLVGLTIVSVGTSLPELVTSIVAARKNEVDMALGNAIGSNIFNFLMVLGIASAISPITFITENIIDIAVLLVFTLIVWVFGATGRKVDKKEGSVMVLLYVMYAFYIVIR